MMRCTKCRGEMDVVSFGEKISIKRCGDCYAIWCHSTMLVAMKEEHMSEMVDVGHAKIGKHYDEVTNVPCPSCQEPMATEPDLHQSHIRLETCTGCKAVLFDAGEFKDWKYNTLMDRFRDIFLGHMD